MYVVSVNRFDNVLYIYIYVLVLCCLVCYYDIINSSHIIIIKWYIIIHYVYVKLEFMSNDSEPCLSFP